MPNRINAEVEYVGKSMRRLGVRLRKGTKGRVMGDHGGVLLVKFDGIENPAYGMVVYDQEVRFTGEIRLSDSRPAPGGPPKAGGVRGDEGRGSLG